MLNSLPAEEMNDEDLKTAALIVKYSGIALTALLGVFSLWKETVMKSADPLRPNIFTRAGKVYLVALLITTVLTISASVLENFADRRIRENAEKRGNEQF